MGGGLVVLPARSDPQAAHVWRVAGEAAAAQCVLRGAAGGAVRAAAVLNGGRQVAVAAAQGTVTLWDVANVMAPHSRELARGLGDVAHLVARSDGTLLAACAGTDTVGTAHVPAS